MTIPGNSRSILRMEWQVQRWNGKPCDQEHTVSQFFLGGGAGEVAFRVGGTCLMAGSFFEKELPCLWQGTLCNAAYLDPDPPRNSEELSGSRAQGRKWRGPTALSGPLLPLPAHMSEE